MKSRLMSGNSCGRPAQPHGYGGVIPPQVSAQREDAGRVEAGRFLKLVLVSWVTLAYTTSDILVSASPFVNEAQNLNLLGLTSMALRSDRDGSGLTSTAHNALLLMGLFRFTGLFSFDTGMRRVSNGSSGDPGEVSDNEVNAHLGNPGLPNTKATPTGCRGTRRTRRPEPPLDDRGDRRTRSHAGGAEGTG
jgi:hypothetical protein